MQPKAVILVGTNGNILIPIKTDQFGNLEVTAPNGLSDTGFFGQANVETTFSDNISSNNLVGLASVSVLLGLNPATGNFDRLKSAPSNADGLTPQAIGDQAVVSQLFGYNGASFDRIRIADVFKSVLATAAGNTIVWTPASGKKFRLMGYTISVAGTLAATGVELMKLTDAAAGTVIAQHQATVAITTPTGDTQIGADLGQGFLSAAANNVLNVNLSGAMLTGGVAVNVWGTEE